MAHLLSFLVSRIYVFWLFFLSLYGAHYHHQPPGGGLGSYLAGPWDWLRLRVWEQKWCSHIPAKPRRARELPTCSGLSQSKLWRCWIPSLCLGVPVWAWAPAVGLGSDQRQPFAGLSHWDLWVVYYRLKPRWSWQIHKDLYKMRFTVALLIIVQF